MRLCEKTIELNICSQWAWSALRPYPPLWFGLTQRQEARAGFDICTKMRGRLFLLQFKASNRLVRGNRRFHASHPQLQALQARLRCQRRAVFYVLPGFGTTAELLRNRCLLSQTWLLDIGDLKNVPPPTTRSGAPRKSKCHYIDLAISQGPPRAILHSAPLEVPVLSLSDLLQTLGSAGQEPGMAFETEAEFLKVCRLFSRNACGLVLA